MLRTRIANIQKALNEMTSLARTCSAETLLTAIVLLAHHTAHCILHNVAYALKQKRAEAISEALLEEESQQRRATVNPIPSSRCGKAEPARQKLLQLVCVPAASSLMLAGSNLFQPE